MKRLLVAVGSCFGAFVAFAAAPVDKVLTINLAGGKVKSSALTDESACITGNEVTNVVVTGGGTLELDADYTAYVGAWDIQNGSVKAVHATGAFGSYGTGAEVTVSKTTGQVWLNGNVSVDKPVHFAVGKTDTGSAAALLRLANSNNVFLRKVTADSNFPFFGGGDFTTRGGFEHKAGTINNQGASHWWYVENEPIVINSWAPVYHNLSLKVAGNWIKSYAVSYSSTITLECDGALSGGPMNYTNKAGGSLQLKGHAAALGKVNVTKAEVTTTGSAPTELTIASGTFSPAAWTGTFGLVKDGGDDLSVEKGGAVSSVTVKGGTLRFGAGVVLGGTQSVTLDGGAIEVGSSDMIPQTAVWTVADATATDVLRIADGVACTCSGLTLGEAPQAATTYGGAASDAAVKLDCFSPTLTGTLGVENVLKVNVASGSANLSEKLTAQQLAAVNANAYSLISKDGAGQLNLDVALTYEGAWDIAEGVVKVVAQDGLGVYGSGAEVKLSTSIAQLYVTGGTIDKPIRFMAAHVEGGVFNEGGELNMLNTTTTFTRKITVEKSLKICFGGTGTIYCRGGMEQLSGTITDAGQSGRWYICDVPAKLSSVTLVWQPLVLQVAGNEIRNVGLSAGGKLWLDCDGALSGYKTAVTCSSADGVSSTGIDLYGHDAEFGKLSFTTGGYIKSTGGAATLAFENATDGNLKAACSDAVTFVKRGAGKTTLTGDLATTGALRIEEGTLSTGGKTLSDVRDVTLAGGRLELTEGALPKWKTLAVADAAAENVLGLPDGATFALETSLTVGGEEKTTAGFYGGAASAAPAANRLALFDATSTGLIMLTRPQAIEVAENRALTDAEKAMLVGNQTLDITKTGAGQLLLDSSLDGFQGVWHIEAGTVKVTTRDHAFGSDDGGTVYLNYGAGASLYLQNGNVNRPVETLGNRSAWQATVYLFQAAASSSNVFEKSVWIRDPKAVVVLYTDAKAGLVMEGPLTAEGDVSMAAAGGYWTFRQPFVCKGIYQPCWVTLRFMAPHNSFNQLYLSNGTTAHVLSDDCFDNRPQLLMGRSSDVSATTWERLCLHGHDVAFGALSLSDKSEISTDADLPATFAFSVSAGRTLTWPAENRVFTGPISAAKGGEGTLAFAGTVPFKGKTFSLEAGTLAYGADAPARWRLDELVVADGATVSIAAGKEIRAKSFAYAGQEQKTGVYGGAASPAPAENRLPCFDPEAGGTVRSGIFGQLLIVR